MRMVGATAGFIMRPFLRRSIACGAIGGIIASALMVLAIWICANEFQLQLTAQEHWTWYIIIAVTLVVVGIIISWLATAFTVRHHITKN